MSIQKKRTFHEDALAMLMYAWHRADDKVKLWEGERARMHIEINKEIARGDPHPESQPAETTDSNAD